MLLLFQKRYLSSNIKNIFNTDTLKILIQPRCGNSDPQYPKSKQIGIIHDSIISNTSSRSLGSNKFLAQLHKDSDENNVYLNIGQKNVSHRFNNSLDLLKGSKTHFDNINDIIPTEGIRDLQRESTTSVAEEHIVEYQQTAVVSSRLSYMAILQHLKYRCVHNIS